MNVIFHPNNKDCTIKIPCFCRSAAKMRLIVSHLTCEKPIKLKPFTDYTNRVHILRGNDVFYVRLVNPPKSVLISIYNEQNGNLPKGEDTSFICEESKFESLPLKTKPTSIDLNHNGLKEFLSFAQWFAENAGVLSATNIINGAEKDSVYGSDEGNFVIIYTNVIKTREGNHLKTPSRVSIAGSSIGDISFAKNAILDYTIPMRLWVCLHEYFHVYRNFNREIYKNHEKLAQYIKDLPAELKEQLKEEVEADMYATVIMLALGYPRIEILEAPLTIFKNSPYTMNHYRWQIIKNLVETFDK